MYVNLLYTILLEKDSSSIMSHIEDKLKTGAVEISNGISLDEIKREPDLYVFKLQDSNHILVIRRNLSLGFYCGYVGVTDSNILFGKGYSYNVSITKDYLEKIKFNNNYFGLLIYGDKLKEDNPKIPLELLFDCNGGLTFSGRLELEGLNLSRYHFFGFDCGHCSDLSILDIKLPIEFEETLENRTYKNFEFVKKQVLNLSEQINSFEK